MFAGTEGGNVMAMHAISENMKNDMLNGKLKEVLEYVQCDDTLCIELRGKYFNIYYRGASIFKVEEIKGEYYFSIDKKYINRSHKLINLKDVVNSAEALKYLPYYKQAIDVYMTIVKGAREREFQQLILRENNSTVNISKSTDYYIADIEYADSEDGSRYDMIGFHWASNGVARRAGKKVRLALIEIKYGDGAISGDASIKKHLDDFNGFINNKAKLEELKKDIVETFKQKCQLGLVEGLQEKQYKDIEISDEIPEIVFIFANHDPDSKILANELATINDSELQDNVLCAVSSYMGYGLYNDSFRKLKDVKDELLLKYKL